MRVAVIGAGWYGCHCASVLMDLGFEVTVYDGNEKIFSRASGHNQYRLHQGYHYVRSFETRAQTRDGFQRFSERYRSLISAPLPLNLYAVPQFRSHIDYRTYKGVMAATGLESSEVQSESFGLSGLAGILSTDERVIHTSVAVSHFMSKLGNRLNLQHVVENAEESSGSVYINGKKFDLCIDATWGALAPPLNVYFEPTVLVYVDGDLPFDALTLVDGDLWSLYPTESPGLFTLSHVRHTPMGRFSSYDAAREVLRTATADRLSKIAEAMVIDVEAVIPYFRESVRVSGFQLSVKTKFDDLSANRACRVIAEGRMFRIFSGKIDTVFHASDRMVDWVRNFQPSGIVSTGLG